MQDRNVDHSTSSLRAPTSTEFKFKWINAYNWVLFGLVFLLGAFRLQQISTHFIKNQYQPTQYYQYDFGAYYVAASTLNIDKTQSLYDRQILEGVAELVGMRTGFSEYIYPPFFAVILRPLARLPQITAINVWAALNLLWLAFSLNILLRIVGLNLSWVKFSLLFFMFLIFPPVYHTIIIFGQVNLFLLVLFVITLYGTHQKDSKAWHIISGLSLGLGVGIKLFFVILIVYYFFYNRRRVSVIASLTVLATIVIGMLGAAPSNTIDYFSEILLDINRIDKTFWVNLSIEPSIKRFFTPGEYQYQLPSMSEPATAIFRPPIYSAALGKKISLVAKYGFAITTAGYFLLDWLSPRRRNRGLHDLLRVSFLLISVLLFLPLSWFSTFVIIIAPLFFLWAYFKAKSVTPEYYYSFALLIFLFWLVNDSFFYLDYLFQRPISTIILSLGFLAILSIWLMMTIILSSHQFPKNVLYQMHANEFNINQKTLALHATFRKHLPLLGILGLGFIVRLIAMQGKGLWYDELQSVTHASLPFQDMLISVRMFDPHPPLYYVQLHYWMKFGASDLWIKFNSILVLLIAIASLYFLTNKYFNRRAAILASTLFAITPYAVHYGIEARNYALWMLLAIWIYELNNRALLNHQKLFPTTGLFVVTVAFLYLHGISFLILPAIYIHASILILRKEVRLRQLGPWMLAQIIIIVAYIPWLKRAWTIGNVTPAVVPGFEDIITTLYIHILGYCNTCPIWLQTIAVLAWLSISVYTVVRLRASQISILAYVFGPVLAAIVISYLMRPIWLFRGLGLIVPFIALITGVWLDHLLHHTRWQKISVVGITVLVFCIFSLALYNQNRTLVYPWDFKQAAQFVKTNAQPGETVYLAHERLFWCFNWYFLGPGQTNPIRSDYSTQSASGIKVISKPAWTDPPTDKGYWQIYRDFDQPLIDTSDIHKQIWDFEELLVEYIPPQPIQ